MSDDLSALFAQGDLASMDDLPLRVAALYFQDAIGADHWTFPDDHAREAADACLEELAQRYAAKGLAGKELGARLSQLRIWKGDGRSARCEEAIEALVVADDEEARGAATQFVLSRLAKEQAELSEAQLHRASQIASGWLASRDPGVSAVDVLSTVAQLDAGEFWKLLEHELERARAALLDAPDDEERRPRMKAFLDLHEHLADLTWQGHLPIDEHRQAWIDAQHQRALERACQWARTWNDVQVILEHGWYSHLENSARARRPRAGQERVEGIAAILEGWDLAATASFRADRDLEPSNDALPEEAVNGSQSGDLQVPDDEQRQLVAQALRSEIEDAVAIFDRGCAALTDPEDRARLGGLLVENLLDQAILFDAALAQHILSIALELSEKYGTPITVKGLESYVTARGVATRAEPLEDELLDFDDDLDPDGSTEVDHDSERLLDALLGRNADPLSRAPGRTAYLDLSDAELDLCLQVRASAPHELSDDSVAALQTTIAARVALGAAASLREQIDAHADLDGNPLYRWRAEVDMACLQQGIGDPHDLALRVMSALVHAGTVDQPILDADIDPFDLLGEQGFDVPSMFVRTLAEIADPTRVTAEGCGRLADWVALVAERAGDLDQVQHVWRAMGHTVRRLDAQRPSLGLVAQYRNMLASDQMTIDDGRALLDFDAGHRIPWQELPSAPWSWEHVRESVGSGQYGSAFAALSSNGEPSSWDLRRFVHLLKEASVAPPLPSRSMQPVEFRLPRGTFRSQARISRRVGTGTPAQRPMRGSDGARLASTAWPLPRRSTSPQQPRRGMGPSL